MTGLGTAVTRTNASRNAVTSMTAAKVSFAMTEKKLPLLFQMLLNKKLPLWKRIVNFLAHIHLTSSRYQDIRSVTIFPTEEDREPEEKRNNGSKE